MIILAIFTLPILLTPFITASNYPAGEMLHGAYSITCHQIVARSYCYFPADSTIADCPPLYSKEIVLDTKTGPAYKFPVCARCLFIYLGALAGGIAVYFTKWKDSKITPNPIYFIIALIPIALDGGSQFLGLRESTNELRMIIGIIAGFAFSFYIIPMLNLFLIRDKNKPKNEDKGYTSLDEQKKETKEKNKKST